MDRPRAAAMTALLVNLALSPVLAVLWWWLRRPGARVLLSVVLALDAVWACALLLAFAGWNHADGFMDCWPDCTEGQDATRVILLGTPVLMAPIGLALLAGLFWSARTRSS